MNSSISAAITPSLHLEDKSLHPGFKWSNFEDLHLVHFLEEIVGAVWLPGRHLIAIGPVLLPVPCR